MVTMFGIPNCDTIKKARTWLEAAGVAYAFHDYKTQSIAPDTLRITSGDRKTNDHEDKTERIISTLEIVVFIMPAAWPQ
jgi:arsenate reductase-like glutaredoxin family protein